MFARLPARALPASALLVSFFQALVGALPAVPRALGLLSAPLYFSRSPIIKCGDSGLVTKLRSMGLSFVFRKMAHARFSLAAEILTPHQIANQVLLLHPC